MASTACTSMSDGRSPQAEQKPEDRRNRRNHKPPHGGVTERLTHRAAAKRSGEDMEEEEDMETPMKKKLREMEPEGDLPAYDETVEGGSFDEDYPDEFEDEGMAPALGIVSSRSHVAPFNHTTSSPICHHPSPLTSAQTTAPTSQHPRSFSSPVRAPTVSQMWAELQAQKHKAEEWKSRSEEGKIEALKRRGTIAVQEKQILAYREDSKEQREMLARVQKETTRDVAETAMQMIREIKGNIKEDIKGEVKGESRGLGSKVWNGVKDTAGVVKSLGEMKKARDMAMEAWKS